MPKRLDQSFALSAINVFMALLYVAVFIALPDEGIPRWLGVLSIFLGGTAAGMHAQIVASRLPATAESDNTRKPAKVSVGAPRRGL